MTAFADEFLDRYARHWKPRTLETNRYFIRNHILPAFGQMTVDAITAEHVRDWFASMGERPGSANRSMPVLSVMMRQAELWGYRAHNSNPCKRTRRYRTRPKERYLSSEEMARLNAVLTRDEFWCPHIVAVIRLLMLTGCRFGEIVSPRMGLDQGQAHPPSRFEVRPAHGLVVERRARGHRRYPRYSEDCPYLFPARPPTRHIDNIAFHWDRIRNEAGLTGLRLHDFATAGLRSPP